MDDERDPAGADQETKDQQRHNSRIAADAARIRDYRDGKDQQTEARQQQNEADQDEQRGYPRVAARIGVARSRRLLIAHAPLPADRVDDKGDAADAEQETQKQQ